jgi:hypothetical protein
MCPRCAGPLRAFPEDSGSRSRIVVERDIAVCGPCGQDEAVRERLGLAPVPPGEWPFREALLTWSDLARPA